MAKKWTTIIEPKHNLVDLKLREVWQYRDLVWLFVKRDFTTRYKQTVLGPLWFIIQPLLLTVAQTFIFGNIAGLSTDGLPQFLFYMAGNVPWLYFSTCLTSTSSTFTNNAKIFGKIYFPRLTTPIATTISSLINFFIQFAMFIIFTLIFMFTGANVHITWVALLTPLFILELAALGMGFGIIISSLTTKYRDLQVLVSFGVLVWMYLSPVIVSGSSLSPTIYNLMMLNPVSPIIELMRYAWLGAGTTPFGFWGISWIVTFVVMLIGIILFNKVEKTFMDTV
ncbi:MAG: ABC transporter permease [Ruminococcus sp.]|nr:ABC transporter permease [Ruminococcus sp.]